MESNANANANVIPFMCGRAVNTRQSTYTHAGSHTQTSVYHIPNVNIVDFLSEKGTISGKFEKLESADRSVMKTKEKIYVISCIFDS